jgi:hypothetical protein
VTFVCRHGIAPFPPTRQPPCTLLPLPLFHQTLGHEPKNQSYRPLFRHPPFSPNPAKILITRFASHATPRPFHVPGPIYTSRLSPSTIFFRPLTPFSEIANRRSPSRQGLGDRRRGRRSKMENYPSPIHPPKRITIQPRSGKPDCAGAKAPKPPSPEGIPQRSGGVYGDQWAGEGLRGPNLNDQSPSVAFLQLQLTPLRRHFPTAKQRPLYPWPPRELGCRIDVPALWLFGPPGAGPGPRPFPAVTSASLS